MSLGMGNIMNLTKTQSKKKAALLLNNNASSREHLIKGKMGFIIGNHYDDTVDKINARKMRKK